MAKNNYDEPCLLDEQIQRLAASPDDPAHAALAAHADWCPACRNLLQEARADLGLIADIRELRQQRAAVKPLVEEVTEASRSCGPHKSKRV